MAVEPDELEEDPLDRPLHRRLLVIVPALVLVGLITYGIATTVRPKVMEGGSAPGFDLALLDGSGRLTDQDLRGTPVVVNFFASWCLPCREEAPELQRLSREYEGRVNFLGVNVQGGLPPTLLDSQKGAEEFVDRFGITYPVVVDENGDLATALMDFYGLPQTFFIDHEWEFAGSSAGERIEDSGGAVVLGAISAERLEAQIEDLLAREVGR